MSFIEPDLAVYVQLLQKLTPETPALWGSMSAQRMVEHLTDTINLARGKGDFKLAIPETSALKAKQFIYTDKPMAQNLQVTFATPEIKLRNADLDDAIDEFTLTWVDFMEEVEENPQLETLHPYFGMLNREDWLKLHAKHFTHHIQQFGLA